MGTMRILALDPPALERLRELRRHGEAHPVTMARMLRTLSGAEKPIGDNPQHRALIPDGFVVVFSIEEHPEGTFRHLSVSVLGSASPTAGPHPKAMAMIAAELGFTIGDDLEFDRSKQMIFPSAQHGWRVPNLLEPFAPAAP